MNDIEVWKPHPEFPFVEVSSFGRVRTVDRWVVDKRYGKRFVKGRILKQYLNRNGYLFVQFSLNGKQVKKKVHRLVAQTFITNQNNRPDVNHKDCNRTNNNIDNLEWCSRSYNQRYREKYGVSFGHPLFAVNLNTMKVSRFSSQSEASRELKISQGNIGMVVRGKRKQAKGYWFTEDKNLATEITKSELHEVTTGKSLGCPVFAIILNTLEVLRFKSQSEASRQLGVSVGSVSDVLKGRLKQVRGYWFTCADNNAVESTRVKFGDSVARKVEELMVNKEL